MPAKGKYTLSDFKSELKETHPNLRVLSTIETNKHGFIPLSIYNVKVKCTRDGFVFEQTAHQLLYGKGCPVCAIKNGEYNNRIPKGFREQCAVSSPNLEILGIDTHTKNKGFACKCKKCGYKFSTAGKSLLKGKECPKCNGALDNIKNRHSPYTDATFKEKMLDVNPNIEILGTYVDRDIKLPCHCKICGHNWDAKPVNLLASKGCPGECKINSIKAKLTLSAAEFENRLNSVRPNIILLEEYKGSATPIKFKCATHNTEFDSTPNQVLHQNHGCIKCLHNGSSWMQDSLVSYFSSMYNILERDKSIIGMELDIVIPELKIAIEPGSWYWHKDKINRDAEKRRLCAEKGYTCITIYDACDKPELVPFRDENTCLIYEDDIGTHKYLLDDVLDSIEDIIKTR